MGLMSSSNKPRYPESVKADIDAALRDHPLVVFSATYCPYCTRTKALLQPFQPHVIEVDSLGGNAMSQYKSYLSEVTGASKITWPRVFIGGKLIGGCDDTTKLHKHGKLEQLIESAKSTPSKLWRKYSYRCIHTICSRFVV